MAFLSATAVDESVSVKFKKEGVELIFKEMTKYEYALISKTGWSKADAAYVFTKTNEVLDNFREDFEAEYGGDYTTERSQLDVHLNDAFTIMVEKYPFNKNEYF